MSTMTEQQNITIVDQNMTEQDLASLIDSMQAGDNQADKNTQSQQDDASTYGDWDDANLDGLVRDEPLDDSEYPALGAEPVQAEPVQAEAVQKQRRSKVKDITFDVMGDRQYRPRRNFNRNNQNNVRDSTRDAGFSMLENKANMSNNLAGTKVCKFVARDQETGEFGVCYRDVCTFAHSLESLKDPMCAFGNKCYHLNTEGRIVCQFRHPFETRDDYMYRTYKQSPDLPETDETTRKPKPKSQPKELGVAHKQRTNPAKPKSRVDLTRPTTPATLAPWATKLVPSQVPLVSSLTPSQVPSVASLIPTSSTTQKGDELVIRVPQEFAEKAIEMALHRGINFRLEIIN